ncbi:MAG: serine hydrolase [Thermoanaerobaculia bacterium]
MKRMLATPLILLAISCTTFRDSGDLGAELDRLIASAGEDKSVGIALWDLETGFQLARSGDEVMHAASTMKVPVMLAVMEAVDGGRLSLEHPVMVRNQFASIVDGSAFVLLAEEDGDPELYEKTGETVTVEELLRRMIVRSSNLATNLLIELVGPGAVMDLMKRLGADDIRVLRGVEDEKAYEAGLNNVTSAWDMMLVMKAIAEQKAVSPGASRTMVEILRGQEFRSKIPAGVPEGIVVANKTGNITKISHDAAIVYPPGRRPYVLVVLTRGFQDPGPASDLIAAISRAVWQHLAAH